MKLDDLTGRRFGMLTITHRWSEASHITKWHCVCDCGGTTIAAAHHLKDGQTKSCGCLKFSRALNLVGEKFYRLTVIGRAPNRGTGLRSKSQWECLCECGNTCVVLGYVLKSGNTKSCGCWKKEVGRINGKKLNFRHGMTNTRVHMTWASMIQRCTDPAHKSYSHYGGRGIHVCERWMKFENFLEDMGDRPAGTTLDRYPDVNGNYEPGNCRWATPTEQANNRRDNFKIEAFGKALTDRGWHRVTGLSMATIIYRLAKGMSPDEALATPPRKNGSKARIFSPPLAA